MAGDQLDQARIRRTRRELADAADPLEAAARLLCQLRADIDRLQGAYDAVHDHCRDLEERVGVLERRGRNERRVSTLARYGS